jgi:hypothetical protein
MAKLTMLDREVRRSIRGREHRRAAHIAVRVLSYPARGIRIFAALQVISRPGQSTDGSGSFYPGRRAHRARGGRLKKKRFPGDLNRKDSQSVRDKRVCRH